MVYWKPPKEEEWLAGFIVTLITVILRAILSVGLILSFAEHVGTFSRFSFLLVTFLSQFLSLVSAC